MAAVSLKDLGTVLEETFAARSKWYYIGLKLGVEASELDAIKKDNPEAVKDCYLEALKCWLKGVAPKPTLAALAEALASDMVDEGGLAEKLRENDCPVVDKSSDGRGELCRPMTDQPAPIAIFPGFISLVLHCFFPAWLLNS